LKHAQRLDDARLAEVLHERGMADLDGIREMLRAAKSGGMPFCEAVVSANMVSDWDLSRVVAELFQLPFLPVDIAKPDLQLWETLRSPLLLENALVPLRCFGQVLTVAMPGLVAADVLGMLAAETDYFLLPVVGTVETNRRWIKEHTTEESPMSDDSWGNLFDEGDAAVQASIDEFVSNEPELDLGALEVVTGLESDDEIDPPSLIDTDEEDSSSSPSGIELPPMPKFGL